MTLPPRKRQRKEPPDKVRTKAFTRIRSKAHCAWVRSHQCIVPGCTRRTTEACHVRKDTDGAAALKPNDIWVVSMCTWESGTTGHHQEQHLIGEPAFEKKYGVDLRALAREFAARSPHRRALEKPNAHR